MRLISPLSPRKNAKYPIEPISMSNEMEIKNIIEFLKKNLNKTDKIGITVKIINKIIKRIDCHILAVFLY